MTEPCASTSRQGKLQSGSVGLIQLIGQCFSIGPLIDIALFLAIVASVAGATGPLAVLLAALGMVAFSLVVAFYASETGGAGAMGDYVRRAWGRKAGVAALGIYVLSLIFSGAGGFIIAVGELISRFASRDFGLELPWWAGALAVCVSAWWLNIRGAAMATRVQFLIVGVSVIPFLITASAAVWHAGTANTWAVFSWDNPHGGDLFAALLFSILLFGGFETAGALAEESSNPRRNIPIALVGTVVMTAFLLILCSYAGTIYYGPDHSAKSWGDAIDGYAVMADNLVGPWAARWIQFAVLVDFTATTIGFTVAASRGIYALAREGWLPARLAEVNGNGAPKQAASFVLGCALLAIGAGLWVPPDKRYDTLFIAATAQAVLLVLVYTALAIGAVRLMLLTPRAQPLWRWIVFPVAALAPGLALYGTFVPFPGYPERIGLFAALAALIAVAIWLTSLNNDDTSR